MNDQFQNELCCVTCSIHKRSISARRSQRKETPLYDMLDVQLFHLHLLVRNREPLCYSLTHSNHVPILCRVVVVFTRYSTSTFTQCSFVLRSNQPLITHVGLLPSGCIMLHCVLNAQLFLVPFCTTQRRESFGLYDSYSDVSSASARISENQGVTHSEQEYCACAMYKANREMIEERDKI